MLMVIKIKNLSWVSKRAIQCGGFWGFRRKLCGGVHEWREISILQLGELVCELRQIEVFHSWWAFCLLFSHKKVRKRLEVNESFDEKPNTFE